jgi:hypothetical protein
MPNMPAKLTRLELVIIVSALVVLVFSHQPPERGNADIRNDIGLTAETPSPIPQIQPDPIQPESTPAEVSEAQPPVAPVPDNPIMESIPARQPKRLGMVDARNRDPIKYPNIMYGQITVRWIWNGTKFEARKVCEVKESDGVVTVWSFDDHHEGVTISEVPADEVPTN